MTKMKLHSRLLEQKKVIDGTKVQNYLAFNLN